jgi:hypothetical protein
MYILLGGWIALPFYHFCFKRFYFICAPTKYTFTLQGFCKNLHLVTRVGPLIQPNNSDFKYTKRKKFNVDTVPKCIMYRNWIIKTMVPGFHFLLSQKINKCGMGVRCWVSMLKVSVSRLTGDSEDILLHFMIPDFCKSLRYVNLCNITPRAVVHPFMLELMPAALWKRQELKWPSLLGMLLVTNWAYFDILNCTLHINCCWHLARKGSYVGVISWSLLINTLGAHPKWEGPTGCSPPPPPHQIEI